MIRLSRKVAVWTFDVEATVAIGRDRPEFLAVARLAADLDRPIGATDLQRELLGPVPGVLAWRVIERCLALGLLARTGDQGPAYLSDSGRLALEHGEVLVPEEGVWRFFLVDDPLVPAGVICAERLESEPAHRERKALKGGQSSENQQALRTPDALQRRHGAKPLKCVRNGSLFQLTELASKGTTGPRAEVELLLTYDKEPSVRLVGHMPGDDGRGRGMDATIDVPDALRNLPREVLWDGLVAHAVRVPSVALARWRATAGRSVVPMGFATTPAAARHAFQMDIAVPASNWQELGQFGPTVLKNQHVVPAADADAQEWLAWLQWEAIDDHTTPELLAGKATELCLRFPHHRPRALTANELLAKAKAQRDERSWFVLGPADLGLWR
jgi:hypothetical protein